MNDPLDYVRGLRGKKHVYMATVIIYEFPFKKSFQFSLLQATDKESTFF